MSREEFSGFDRGVDRVAQTVKLDGIEVEKVELTDVDVESSIFLR